MKIFILILFCLSIFGCSKIIDKSYEIKEMKNQILLYKVAENIYTREGIRVLENNTNDTIKINGNKIAPGYIGYFDYEVVYYKGDTLKWFFENYRATNGGIKFEMKVSEYFMY